MKKFLITVFVLFNSFLFAQVRVGWAAGSSSLPAAVLMENVVSINGEQLDFEKYMDSKSLLQSLLNQQTDICFLPVNVAARAYNSTDGKILCCGVTEEGSTTLITKNKKIKNLSELKGKTVYLAQEGGINDCIIRFILEKNNLAVSDTPSSDTVCLSYSLKAPQLISAVSTDKIEYAVVSEPYVTIAKEKDSAILSPVSLFGEYKKYTQSQNYPVSVMVVSRDFVLNHTEVLNQFIKEYEQAYYQAIALPRYTASLCQKFDFGLEESTVIQLLENSNPVFIASKSAQNDIEQLLKILQLQSKSADEEKLPDSQFYY